MSHVVAAAANVSYAQARILGGVGLGGFKNPSTPDHYCGSHCRYHSMMMTSHADNDERSYDSCRYPFCGSYCNRGDCYYTQLHPLDSQISAQKLRSHFAVIPPLRAAEAIIDGSILVKVRRLLCSCGVCPCPETQLPSSGSPKFRAYLRFNTRLSSCKREPLVRLPVRDPLRVHHIYIDIDTNHYI